MMKSTDPASLQNLNDIVLPPDIGWWPMATGWYVLMPLLVIMLMWLAHRFWKVWQNNRYRREAIQQFNLLAEQINNDQQRSVNLRQIPILLKRTALSVYPRRRVASLTDTDWLAFLNSSTSTPLFNPSAANTLIQIPYNTQVLEGLDSQRITELLSACSQWLKKHRPDIHSFEDES